jgi:hypothetical protein
MDLVEADPSTPTYYTEDAHPPAFQSFFAVAASNDQYSVTPMVVLDSKDKKNSEPELFVKSDVILRHFCPYLYPNDIRQEVMDMEDELGDRLGATLRVFLYHNLLRDEYYAVLTKIMGRSTSGAERFLISKMMSRGIAKGMRKIMNINEESAEESKAHVLQLFDELSEKLLANGGNYLMDKQGIVFQSRGFTAADLTMAALAGPIIRPPELINFQCTDEELPPEVLELSQTLRASRAGKHVLKMYSEHRFGIQPSPGSTGQTIVTVKTADRDRFPWPELSIAIAVIAAVIGIVVQVKRGM